MGRLSLDMIGSLRRAGQRGWVVLAAATLAAGLASGGCVTEVVKRPAAPAGIGQGEGFSSRDRVQMEIQGLGAAGYDGLTLPLVSPDGQWLVSQSGTSPDWPVLLGYDDAAPPAGQKLSIYRLGSARLEVVEELVATEPGVILSRSCDDRGFLVERVLDDRSRWIGFVPWTRSANEEADRERGAASRVRWLIADEHHNTHPTLGPGGELVWSRLRLGASVRELVWRDDAVSASGRRTNDRRCAIADETLVQPLFGWSLSGDRVGDPAGVWAFSLRKQAGRAAGDGGLKMSLLLVKPHEFDAGLLREAARLDLKEEADLLSVYQMTAMSPTPARVEDSGVDRAKQAPRLGLRGREIVAIFSPAQACAMLAATQVRAPSRTIEKNMEGAQALSAEAVGEQVDLIRFERGSTQAMLIQDAAQGSVRLILTDSEGVAVRDYGNAEAAAREKGSRGVRLLAGEYTVRSGADERGAMILFTPPLEGGKLEIRVLRAKSTKP